VVFTAQHAQLVVMCLRPGEEIGDEVHPNVDQFFRIEQGEAKFVFNSPPNHPDGTVHKTKAETEAAELVEHR